MKYLYTPFDVAVYLRTENLTISEEQNMLDTLWEKKDLEIWSIYRYDKQSFKKKVHHELHMMDGYLDDMDALNLIFREMGSKFSLGETDYEQGVIESYFKIIKVEMYNNKIVQDNIKKLKK